jgi:hypothetical protein
MAINSLSGAWNTLQNPDLSPFEKFLQISTSLSMTFPMLKRGFSEYGEAMKGTALYQNALAASTAL